MQSQALSIPFSFLLKCPFGWFTVDLNSKIFDLIFFHQNGMKFTTFGLFLAIWTEKLLEYNWTEL